MGCETGMFQSRNRPTQTEWADRKPVIEQLYLEQNRTLEEVSAILAEDDFHATIRQYKTRLKSWGYDNKKIRADVWKAMSFGLTFLKRHNQQAVFLVPVRGGQVKEVGQELIGKQMRRTTGYLKDLGPVLDILATNKIDISCSDLTTGKKTRYVHTDFGALAALGPSSKVPAVAIRTIPDGKPQNSLSQVSTSLPPTSPLTTSHTASGTPATPLTSLTSPSISSKLGRLTKSPGSQYSQSAVESVAGPSSDDFDIMSAFGQLFQDKSCSPVMRDALWNYVGAIFPTLVVGSLDEEKRMATQWIAYYVLTLGPEQNGVGTMEDDDRRYAKNVFKNLLTHHSRFIYPFCSSVIMVLGSEPPDERLEAFLNDCCDVIDNHMHGQELNYGSPFHVARALWLRDTTEIDHYESSFARSTESIGFIWGRESPNYIVNQHYYAWLKLHKNNHREAINLMRDLLPKARAIMGKKHPLTINCYATLSRAQAELGEDDSAINDLQKALELLQEHSRLLNKYEDRLRRRLAQLWQKIGNFAEAEAIFWRVLEFRLQYFGIESPITWSVIEDIRNMLTSRSRPDDATAFDNDMNNRWRIAKYESSIAKYGSPPDWLCANCSNPVCQRQCGAPSTSSPTQSLPTRQNPR